MHLTKAHYWLVKHIKGNNNACVKQVIVSCHVSWISSASCCRKKMHTKTTKCVDFRSVSGGSEYVNNLAGAGVYVCLSWADHTQRVWLPRVWGASALPGLPVAKGEAGGGPPHSDCACKWGPRPQQPNLHVQHRLHPLRKTCSVCAFKNTCLHM